MGFTKSFDQKFLFGLGRHLLNKIEKDLDSIQKGIILAYRKGVLPMTIKIEPVGIAT
tara:strand:+ start:562 stop:732 length:171 start_codon:yes stop_codon:yes gene_type:complete